MNYLFIYLFINKLILSSYIDIYLVYCQCNYVLKVACDKKKKSTLLLLQLSLEIHLKFIRQLKTTLEAAEHRGAAEDGRTDGS